MLVKNVMRVYLPMLALLLMGLSAGGAWAGVSNVTVKNSLDRSASDLHITFSGTGGSILVEPESVTVNPGNCPTPSIPSYNKTTDELVIGWGKNNCVEPGAADTTTIPKPEKRGPKESREAIRYG
jgi:hypothetical protein